MPSLTILSPRRMPRLFTALLACSVLTVSACDDDDDPVNPDAELGRTVAVTPATRDIAVGATQQFTAELRDAAGAAITGRTVTWSVADTAVASISESGVVTMKRPGFTTVVALIDGVRGFAPITAIAPVNSVTLSGPPAPIRVGGTFQLEFAALDSRGTPIGRPVTFTSSAPTVATVSGTGLVTAVGAGTATITATSEGKSTTATVNTFLPAPVATITLNQTSATVPQGNTLQLTATLRDAAGTALTDRVTTWTSSNTSVATVSNAGLVTIVGGGTVTITAASEGITATSTITNVLPTGSRTVAGATDSDVSFYVNVPAGTTTVGITLRGGTGDPDLYVYRAGQTTIACTQESAGPDETCSIATNGVTGLWRVRIIGFEAYAGTTLNVTFTP